MRRDLPLHGLRAFEAAARHQSFQNAAGELAVSPTAISHQIRQLEDQLGVVLFRRQPRPITLTEAGARLFPRVRDALDELEQAVAALRPESPHETLTVSTTRAFASRWLLPRLPRFYEAHPGISVNVHAAETVSDLPGTADCAVRYTRRPPEDQICFPLFRDRFFPLAAKALLAGDRPLSHVRDLADHTLISFEWTAKRPDNPTWRRWLEAVADQWGPIDTRGQRHIVLSEESHAIQAAAEGLGIALCSSLMAIDLLQQGVLHCPFGFGLDGYLSVLVYPTASRGKPHLVAFREWLCREAQCFREAHPGHLFADR
ncbi:LysR family transcriptional regulator [Sulfidibacter corallicola]|uniref:LysR family transcriptional regulator n=1 Tax=Sulfidibacter corallicola TaxID=2818388 RepID=A0A8A4TL61_SULCO|nr:LysR substrate-binding domain-containing protein [Sulfidibacter corallicola]QTD50280.1 LysR family transcriptional regulator [Sulfidibacter corallicola]